MHRLSNQGRGSLSALWELTRLNFDVVFLLPFIQECMAHQGGRLGYEQDRHDWEKGSEAFGVVKPRAVGFCSMIRRSGQS